MGAHTPPKHAASCLYSYGTAVKKTCSSYTILLYEDFFALIVYKDFACITHD